MTSLDFLYISLGIGFIIFIIFLCVLILQVTLILRDVNKTTGNIKDISDRVKSAVFEPIDYIADTFTNWTFMSSVIDSIKEKVSKFKSKQKKENSDEDAEFKVNDIK